jgi:hypothetical protein
MICRSIDMVRSANPEPEPPEQCPFYGTDADYIQQQFWRWNEDGRRQPPLKSPAAGDFLDGYDYDFIGSLTKP